MGSAPLAGCSFAVRARLHAAARGEVVPRAAGGFFATLYAAGQSSPTRHPDEGNTRDGNIVRVCLAQL